MVISLTKPNTRPLSPANHPGPAQLRNSSPGLLSRSVCPKYLESRDARYSPGSHSFRPQRVCSSHTPRARSGSHPAQTTGAGPSPSFPSPPNSTLSQVETLHSSAPGPSHPSSSFLPHGQEAPRWAALLSTRSMLAPPTRTAFLWGRLPGPIQLKQEVLRWELGVGGVQSADRGRIWMYPQASSLPS